MKEKIQIIWCKKNLRREDNEILANINPSLATLGVYFFEPTLVSLPDVSHFHLRFILECLISLQKSFMKLGIPLLILPYDALQGFEKLAEFFEIESIYSHEETGNYASFIRDKKVIKYCKSKSIFLKEYANNGVVRRLKSRNQWSKIWGDRMEQEIFMAQKMQVPLEIPSELREISKQTKETYKNELRSYSIGPVCEGGEEKAHQILISFLETRSKKYMYHISKPFESQNSCSRVSPYITYGCISIKYILHKSSQKMEELKKKGDETSLSHRKSINFFLARIHWQSHFIQKLEDEPELEFRNLNPLFDTIRKDIDTELIDKIFRAQSGIPYIDATVRELQQTGWTNFRSRAILVSFLCNTCMQPWQAIGGKLAQLFLDYEPGIHYPQLQMQAGTTGINTIRIYNPILNGQEKDSEGIFIRQYMPELRDVPNIYIHEPWLWEKFDSLDYPLPLVDLISANRIARDILWKTKGNTPKKIKEKIVRKHASRAFRAKKIKKRENTEIQITLF